MEYLNVLAVVEDPLHLTGPHARSAIQARARRREAESRTVFCVLNGAAISR